MSPLPYLSYLLLLLEISATSSQILRPREGRSGLAGYDDPYALTDAIQAIDRERRRSNLQARLEESLLGDGDDAYFNPNSMSDLNEDYMRSLQYLDNPDQMPEYYPGYNFEEIFDDMAPVREYPYGGAAVYGPKKRTAFSPHKVSPSLDQLRNLFGEANIPRKRMAAQRIPNLIESEQSIRHAEEDTRQLAHKLMQEAQKITETAVVTQSDGNPPEVVKDVKIEKTNPDGTTQTLEEVFKGAETDKTVPDASDSADTSDSDNAEHSEQLTTDDDDDTVGQTKTKRASSEPCAQESAYIGELLAEIAGLRDKLAKLDAQQVLEDKENDLLADALVYSTLDQLGGGSDFVNKEYSDIAKATDTEELIQMLADGKTCLLLNPLPDIDHI